MYFSNERMGYREEIKKPVGFALLRGVTGINILILQYAKKLSIADNFKNLLYLRDFVEWS